MRVTFVSRSTIASTYPQYAIVNCTTALTWGMTRFPSPLPGFLKAWKYLRMTNVGGSTIFFFTDNLGALNSDEPEKDICIDLAAIKASPKDWHVLLTAGIERGDNRIVKRFELAAIMQMVTTLRPDMKGKENIIVALLNAY